MCCRAPNGRLRRRAERRASGRRKANDRRAVYNQRGHMALKVPGTTRTPPPPAQPPHPTHRARLHCAALRRLLCCWVVCRSERARGRCCAIVLCLYMFVRRPAASPDRPGAGAWKAGMRGRTYERENAERRSRSPRDSNSGAGLGVPNEQEQQSGRRGAMGGREGGRRASCILSKAAPLIALIALIALQITS